MGRLRQLWEEDVHHIVFPVSAALIIAFVMFAALFTDTAAEVFTPLQGFIVDTFGWFFILAVTVFLAVVVYLVVSPYGRIKLGPDDSTPDYSTPAWFAMLFSAGMGIGLVFFGVAEPIFLFDAPARVEGGTAEAARESMNFTFHHWGFTPWAVYAIAALGLAYFGYRREMPMTVRSLFHPLLGDRIHGPLGHGIDIVAVVANLFGIATSLGFGVQQIATGLSREFGWEIGDGGMLLLIGAITALATISVVLGLDKGIKWLSQINIAVATGLAVVVLLLGPTLFLLFAYLENTGNYIQNMFDTLMWTGAYAGEDAQQFLGDWTIFYWAWWISWAPFVGMFIARVSRGRTIRQFLVGVLLAPTLVSFAWFTIFGNTALQLELAADGAAGILDEVLEVGEDVAMFALFEALGLAGWQITALSLVTIFIISVFFVTSSDSGSFVLDMITSGGKLDPAVETRVFWAVSEGAIAAALLLTGGLAALQAGAISAGLPFSVLLLLATWSLLKALREEQLPGRSRPRTETSATAVPEASRRESEDRVVELERELEQKEKELDRREAALSRGDRGPGDPAG